MRRLSGRLGLVVSSENSPHNATQDGVWPLIKRRGPGIPSRPGALGASCCASALAVPSAGFPSHGNGKSHHRSTWELVITLYYKNLSQNACALIVASKNHVCIDCSLRKRAFGLCGGVEGIGVQARY